MNKLYSLGGNMKKEKKSGGMPYFNNEHWEKNLDDVSVSNLKYGISNILDISLAIVVLPDLSKPSNIIIFCIRNIVSGRINRFHYVCIFMWKIKDKLIIKIFKFREN